MRRLFIPMLTLILACTGSRLYYLRTELPNLEGSLDQAVAPGPWMHENVPIVVSDTASVPDDLVLPTLRALMTLPGAADACDTNTGYPRPDAAEYCVAIYRTPEDWRVSWPIRDLTGERSSCKPPFGGVEDADFGRDLPVFGFAHNHPCATLMSSPDLVAFPELKTGEGFWVVVSYATSPSGRLARDSQGQLIPAWAWLATGHKDEPRFYRWNPAGEVFRWSEDTKSWEFQAICQPQSSGMFGTRAFSPRCSPELKW
ncbi:hypothetical protein DAT35_01070 [Vitiosangium sp. GDMCC 1.1324]|nr:hypothetical protein DAT35_01070 [Vitiosangium sp. GDMCC 1.1324]